MILLKLKENLLLYVRKKIILITFPQISSDLRRVLRLYKKTKKIDITYLVKQSYCRELQIFKNIARLT